MNTSSAEKPLVTAVITSYKRDRSIVKRALESVLSQTYSPLEILIIDDNRGEGAETFSSGIREIARGKENVKVIKTERGNGAQRARNTGIEHAAGKYIAFLDDDDEWLPGKIAGQVRLLEDNPEAGLCYASGYLIDRTFKPTRIGYFRRGDNIGYEDLLITDRIGTTTQAMIPKWVFDRVGLFDESLPARQDYEMWLRITKQFSTVWFSEYSYNYYKESGPGQLTRNWKNCIRGYEIIYEKYKEDIDKNRKARFNIVFHIAHHMMEGANAGKDMRLKFRAACGYAESFIISPSSFLLQAKYFCRDSSRRLKSWFKTHIGGN